MWSGQHDIFVEMSDSEKGETSTKRWTSVCVCQALCFVDAFGWTLTLPAVVVVFSFSLSFNTYAHIQSRPHTFIDHRINYTNTPVIITI